MTPAIVLSAGASSRMGRLKPLLEIKNHSLLEDQVFRLNRAGVSQIIVVVGCKSDEIISALKRLAVTWSINNEWEKGSFSSLLCAISKLQKNEQGVLILPVDTVGVEPEIIKKIINKGISSQKNIIPTFQSQGGHPVYINKDTIDIILNTPIETGRLDTILSKSRQTLKLEVPSKNILNNINTIKEWKEIFLK